jgi:hypothetical protein
MLKHASTTAPSSTSGDFVKGKACHFGRVPKAKYDCVVSNKFTFCVLLNKMQADALEKVNQEVFI